jgi:hypothetical protein
MSEPTTVEIVRNFRGAHIFGITQALENRIADHLESQERELSEIAGELERFRAFHERYAEQTSKKYVNDVCALTARAEQAEQERDAAKADMKLIVDAVRETHCDETCCFACKHDCDMSINDSGEFNNECPGFDRDDCFDWRGLPREGEGK